MIEGAEMRYQCSCHCGQVKFDVEGEIKDIIECNCSICSKRGYLLWFTLRSNIRPQTDFSSLKKYQFGDKTIDHMFCQNCGVAPVGFGLDPKSDTQMAAINVRCLDNFEISSAKIIPFDGKNL